MSATEVVFYYVLPITGCCLVLAMASSPVKAMRESEARGELGPFNPFPPVLFLMTNLVWVINGLLISNVFVFFINVVMVFVNGHITMRCYRMADPHRATQMELLILVFSSIAMMFGFGFIYGEDQDSVREIFGWLCAAFNMCVFVPPMLLMQEVIQKRDAIQINAPFAVVGAINTAFWCMYGLLIPIYPLLIPNAFGCALSIVQVMLTAIFPGEGVVKGSDVTDVKITTETELSTAIQPVYEPVV